MTATFKRQIEAAIPENVVCTTERDGQRVLWAPGSDPNAYRAYRPRLAGGARRDLADTPLCEIDNAAEDLRRQFGAFGSQEELYAEAAARFGADRLTETMKKRILG